MLLLCKSGGRHTISNAQQLRPSLTWPNLVCHLQVFLTPTHLGIAMEYAAGGELFDRIVKAGRFSEGEARFFFQQLISGVDNCHSEVSCASLQQFAPAPAEACSLLSFQNCGWLHFVLYLPQSKPSIFVKHLSEHIAKACDPETLQSPDVTAADRLYDSYMLYGVRVCCRVYVIGI